jgi:hypothetical protein
MVAIAGHLHQPVDAIVMRWEAALSISVAIAAAETEVCPPRHALSQGRQNLFDLLGALHTHLARFRCANSK